jgi:hypothetical protein
MARQSCHYLKESLVFDAAPGDVPFDHGPTRFAKDRFWIFTRR